jgi:hypothetical protein
MPPGIYKQMLAGIKAIDRRRWAQLCGTVHPVFHQCLCIKPKGHSGRHGPWQARQVR